MSTLDWTLNLAILALMISTVVGKRTVTLMTYLRPLVIVGGVGVYFLQDLPTAGHDVPLELAGVLLGVVFGVLAAAASRVYRQGERVVVQSGGAYAAVWLAAIGLRVAFAELATRNPGFGRWVAEFSMQHAITGADAWRAAFVLMALAMVVTRVALIALRSSSARGPSLAAAR
ncbi:hypothetical protein E5F05_02885 (plasmid) [Deinococcus metallilatus]|uniref:Membrane protein CcdC involved in cytochrome C biogenesis n=1 Tax=Deinococcus metallilatus TaxID=1211322 RepID=A0AAJ5F699_9DEIO|nr:hypothetical protein [Deinococcus metallilatus]MBB5295651.1 membrane protein CcdC involved in cytochrome C biogenesis [Deinococcus metallilatus]QBY06889.1 hypothetical protein E5F05_02885 [Deinococcus metallilatus]TLK32279.1 hypothetical protein FCS05_02220 [Deinococcus metallilatus]GMA14181.1 hypothetical protein GCM10025871_05120 [Deinococcus metallilatus]